MSDGLTRIGKLFVPIDDAIGDRNKSENHWNADETRWMVFSSYKDKKGNRWYVWFFCSETTVYYKISPTRGACVVADHYKDSFGIITADRYVAYKTLLAAKLFLIAYCWTHVRRDFLEIEKGYEHFSDWAKSWVLQIGLLYHINNERVIYQVGSIEFDKCHESLVAEIAKMRFRLDNELSQYKDELPSARKKVLESLSNHWHGLILFVQFSWLPMDNNRAEREGRDPVLGRKNYYGSGSVESSETAHMSFTIISTVELWGLNANLWFASYLQACAENNGKSPTDLRRFLPWSMTNEERKNLGRKSEEALPVKYSNITKEEIKCATVDEIFLKKKSKPSKKLSKKPLSQNYDSTSQEKSVKNLTG
jgi:transposase